MNNLLDRLIGQLNALIPFLAISHRDVFELIQAEKDIWFLADQRSSLPDSYIVYRTQITHSAFLLGYSYFEAFLADLVREIYLSNSQMLPRDKQLKFAEVLAVESYEEVLEMMIEKEIIDLMYQGIEKIIEYFERKLNLEWPDECKSPIVAASYMRNCIVHNNSRADLRLSQVSKYGVDDIIELTTGDVNSYGIVGRDVARRLHTQAVSRYLGDSP